MRDLPVPVASYKRVVLNAFKPLSSTNIRTNCSGLGTTVAGNWDAIVVMSTTNWRNSSSLRIVAPFRARIE